MEFQFLEHVQAIRAVEEVAVPAAALSLYLVFQLQQSANLPIIQEVWGQYSDRYLYLNLWLIQLLDVYMKAYLDEARYLDSKELWSTPDHYLQKKS